MKTKIESYQLVIFAKTVTNYNEETLDWSGESFSVDLDMKTYINTFHYDDILLALSELGFIVEKDDLFLENDEYASFNQTENGAGFLDENGNYLCDYRFIIKPICEPINLQKYFKGE